MTTFVPCNVFWLNLDAFTELWTNVEKFKVSEYFEFWAHILSVFN